MIPVHQTILACPIRGDGHDADGRPGDCYRAAIASVLDLPIDEVPHFACFTDDWVERSEAWFLRRGIVRSFYYGDALSSLIFPLWIPAGADIHGHTVDRIVGALGAGPSPRGAFRHCVVLDPETGRLAHDPHPSGAGLVELDEIEVLFQIADSSVSSTPKEDR